MSWFVIKDDDAHAVWHKKYKKFCCDYDAEYDSNFSYPSESGAKKSMARIKAETGANLTVVSRKELFDMLGVKDWAGDIIPDSRTPKWLKGENPSDVLRKLLPAVGINPEQCKIEAIVPNAALTGTIGRKVSLNGEHLVTVGFLPSTMEGERQYAIPVSQVSSENNELPLGNSDCFQIKGFNIWVFQKDNKSISIETSPPPGWTGKTFETYAEICAYLSGTGFARQVGGKRNLSISEDDFSKIMSNAHAEALKSRIAETADSSIKNRNNKTV